MAEGGGVFAGWVPECYLDEVTPPPRDEPEDWLKVDDGAVRLDGQNGHPDDEPGPVLLEGVVIRFYSLTCFPDAILDYGGKLGRSRLVGEVPEGASLMSPHDETTLSESFDELLKAFEGTPPGRYAIRVFRWCEGKTLVLREGRLVVPQ